MRAADCDAAIGFKRRGNPADRIENIANGARMDGNESGRKLLLATAELVRECEKRNLGHGSLAAALKAVQEAGNEND